MAFRVVVHDGDLPATSKFSSKTSVTMTAHSYGTVSPAKALCAGGLTDFSTSHSWRSSYVPAAVLLMTGA